MVTKEYLLSEINNLLTEYSNFEFSLESGGRSDSLSMTPEIRKFYAFEWANEELVELLFGGREVVRVNDFQKGFDHALSIEANTRNFLINKYSMELMTIEDDKTDVLESNVEISSFLNLYPLFEFEGSYILQFESEDESLNGLICEVDTIGSYFAPTIEHHLRDLYKGLSDGKYPIIDNELVYPSAWHCREKLHAGKVVMDEYGNIQ